MPPDVIDAAQRAQDERARIIGYLRNGWRGLVVRGPLTSGVERALAAAGFVRIAPLTWCWRPN